MVTRKQTQRGIIDLTELVRPLLWVASARRDLQAMPEEVQDAVGYALYFAQTGRKHDQAKALKGFGSAGVLEVIEDSVRAFSGIV